MKARRKHDESVWLLCCGGSNYAAALPADAQMFNTVGEARRYLAVFYKWHLAKDVVWHVYIGDKPDGQGYPDQIATLGPRGAVRLRPA